MQHQLHHRYFGEVLPYLEIKKQETEEDITESVVMPNVTGITVEEASKILKELGLQVNIISKTEEIDEEKNKEKIVSEQLPKKGIQINTSATVNLYWE